MNKYALEVKNEVTIFDTLENALQAYSKTKTYEPKIKLHKVNSQNENDLFFGVVKWFDTKKQFGFLSCEDFEPHNLFIHSTLLSRVGCTTLQRGQGLFFNPFSAEGFVDKSKVAYLKLANDYPWWEVYWDEENFEWIQASNPEDAIKYANFLTAHKNFNPEAYLIHNPYERALIIEKSSGLFVVLTNNGENFDLTEDVDRATVFVDEPYKLSINRIIVSYGNKTFINGSTFSSMKFNLTFCPIKL